MQMGWTDWLLLVIIIIAVIVGLLIFLSKKAYKKMDEQNEFIEQNKMLQTAFIIDKTRDRITNIKSLPKAVTDNMPKRAALVKMYFVKVKIGPQITTLMTTDKHLYEALPLKKTVKLEIAGLYIVNMIGLKSPEQAKAIEKEKKEKEKAEQKAAKEAAKQAKKEARKAKRKK